MRCAYEQPFVGQNKLGSLKLGPTWRSFRRSPRCVVYNDERFDHRLNETARNGPRMNAKSRSRNDIPALMLSLYDVREP